MHLVLASAQHHPSHGGIGTYVWEFIHAAGSYGWCTELITRPSAMIRRAPLHALHEITTHDTTPTFQKRVAALRRIDRIRPYRYGLWSLAVANRLLELNTQPDAIAFVDCQAEGFVSLTSASVRRRFRSARFLVSAHTPMWLNELLTGQDPARFGRSIYHEWERMALAHAEGVIAPSTRLLHRIGAHSTSVALPPPMRQVQACVPADNPVIVLVGAVQPQKGVHVWATSLNRVLMSKPRATAVLIGPDTPTAPDGLSMAAHVQRLIDPRCINRFRWIGAQTHDRVMQIVDDAALVVVPSAFESFSYAAAEAIMRGRPVVVSDQVGLGEHVAGLMTVPCNDADALAEAQLAVLNDLPAANERALALRAKLIAACEPKRHVDRLAQFISSVSPAVRPAALHDEPDAIEEMKSFLQETQQMIGSLSDIGEPTLAA